MYYRLCSHVNHLPIRFCFCLKTFLNLVFNEYIIICGITIIKKKMAKSEISRWKQIAQKSWQSSSNLNEQKIAFWVCFSINVGMISEFEILVCKPALGTGSPVSFVHWHTEMMMVNACVVNHIQIILYRKFLYILLHHFNKLITDNLSAVSLMNSWFTE